MQNQKGFTIIELIVVIAIIGILAGIVMVNVAQYVQKSKDARLHEEFHQISVAANTYYADEGIWAEDVNQGVAPSFVTNGDNSANGNTSPVDPLFPSWSASWYGTGYTYDYENWSGMYGFGSPCIGIHLRDASVGVVHGYPIENDGCKNAFNWTPAIPGLDHPS